MLIELMKNQYVMIITDRLLVAGIKLWVVFEKARNDKAKNLICLVTQSFVVITNIFSTSQ